MKRFVGRMAVAVLVLIFVDYFVIPADTGVVTTTEEPFNPYIYPDINLTFNGLPDPPQGYVFEIDIAMWLSYRPAVMYLHTSGHKMPTQFNISYSLCPLVNGTPNFQSEWKQEKIKGNMKTCSVYFLPQYRCQEMAAFKSTFIQLLLNWGNKQTNFLTAGIEKFIEYFVIDKTTHYPYLLNTTTKWGDASLGGNDFAYFLLKLNATKGAKMIRLGDKEKGKDLVQILNLHARKGTYKEDKFWGERFNKTIEQLWDEVTEGVRNMMAKPQVYKTYYRTL